ncbi:hypothetical protein BWI96_18665 [Siphonobacter sp. SORGH_AS_0500]|nr:hypothetical protein BWI96_18665 [Siphonobacter sp. SORGH_AS_0500]
MLWLTSCNRSATTGFQKSTAPSYERQVAAKTTTPATSEAVATEVTPVQTPETQAPVAVAKTTDQPASAEKPVTLPKVTPEMIASASERLVTQTKGTAFEKQALVIQKKLAKIQKKASSDNLNAAQKSVVANKMMTKLVTKKVQKQLAKAKKANKTNALSQNVKVGLILLLVGVIFLIIPVNVVQIIGLIMMVIGAVILLIGLLDSV